jgi:SET and MYND domain-containing protein 5
MSPEGFLSLIAMVGTNGQGVGSSALAEWAKNAGELDLPQSEKDELEQFIDNLYNDWEDGMHNNILSLHFINSYA